MTTTTTPAYTPESVFASRDMSTWRSTWGDYPDPTVHILDRWDGPLCQGPGRKVSKSLGVVGEPVTCPDCTERLILWADKLDRQLAEWQESLMSGRRFALVAASNRSARSASGYMPKLSDRDYGQAFAYLADLAQCGPMAAELAGAAIRKVNLHGTVHDMIAAVAESFAATMREPFDDVLARTGPEPIRYSQAQRPWPLAVRLLADATLSRIDALSRTHVGGVNHFTLKLAENGPWQVARWAK